MEIINVLDVKTKEDFRSWLQQNYKTEKACFVALSRKKDSDKIYYIDAVYEALCFGWIDSTLMPIDGQSYQRFSPRSKKSPWTELNKARVRKLRELGLMTEEGLKVVPGLDDPFMIDVDILEAIKSDHETYQNFLKLPELYKRVRIDNIQRIRKDQVTFQKRLNKFLENTKQNIIFGDWHDDGKLL